MTEETIKQLKQEIRTGQAAPKNQEQKVDPPKVEDPLKDQEKNYNQPEGIQI